MERTIKQDAPKISDALYAMVRGLRDASDRTDFVVSMETYGDIFPLPSDTPKGICAGCAATCALQEIGGKRLTLENIEKRRDRADFYSYSPEELNRFEFAIDLARKGKFWNICYFYDANSRWPKAVDRINEIAFSEDKFGSSFPILHNGTWRANLKKYESLVDEIAEAGF